VGVSGKSLLKTGGSAGAFQTSSLGYKQIVQLELL